MKSLLISLLIGLAAAAVDTLPMILKKLDRMFILSAFFFWLVLGVLIPRVQLLSSAWLNGLVTALLVLVPLLFLIYRQDREALLQICLTTLVLGAAVGWASGRFIP